MFMPGILVFHTLSFAYTGENQIVADLGQTLSLLSVTVNYYPRGTLPKNSTEIFA